MNKLQIILILVAIAAVAALYSLPKSVVDNDQNDTEVEFVDESAPTGVVDHSSAIPEKALEKIDYWKAQLIENGQMQENEIALDSLMQAFQQVNKYDSAATYAASYADNYQKITTWRKAGDAFYEAFTFAIESNKMQYLAEKARTYYNKILEAGTNDLTAKNNIAMTYVAGNTPMQGIAMLREILSEDPQNKEALYNMGVLSMRSNQFERGIQRFEALVKYHPEYLEGNFYLGVCYFETGQMAKAKEQFQKVLKLDTDATVQTTVEEYLQRIK